MSGFFNWFSGKDKATNGTAPPVAPTAPSEKLVPGLISTKINEKFTGTNGVYTLFDAKHGEIKAIVTPGTSYSPSKLKKLVSERNALWNKMVSTESSELKMGNWTPFGFGGSAKSRKSKKSARKTKRCK